MLNVQKRRRRLLIDIWTLFENWELIIENLWVSVGSRQN